MSSPPAAPAPAPATPPAPALALPAVRSAGLDPHSFARPDEARVRHVGLDLDVDFAAQVLVGAATLKIERAVDAQELVLDSRDLTILEVATGTLPPSPTDAPLRLASPPTLIWTPASWRFGGPHPALGTPLHVTLPAGADVVKIRYRSAPNASGLQWLGPEQTADRVAPFLYTQSQAINARSWVPVQDSPGVRITFDARISAPAGTRPVMAAESLGVETEPGGRIVHRFALDQAVPSYLLALAVGRLESASTGPRTGVWAEPGVLARAHGRVRRHGGDAHQHRAAVRPLSLGSLRGPGAAAGLPLRRHGEPARHLRHPDDPRGRPLAGRPDRPRAGPQLVRQPRLQRDLARPVAQRGLHRLHRASHRRGHLRGRARGDPGRARPPGSDAHPRGARRPPRRSGPSRRARRPRSRRRVLRRALREGLPVPAPARGGLRAPGLRRLRAALVRRPRLHQPDHRGAAGLPRRRAADEAPPAARPDRARRRALAQQPRPAARRPAGPRAGARRRRVRGGVTGARRDPDAQARHPRLEPPALDLLPAQLAARRGRRAAGAR